jgi:hypothetical protein
MRSIPYLLLVVTLSLAPSADPATGPALSGQDQAKVTTALQQLKPGPKAQWEAIYTIAKSLDPRIPAACLPMLQSSNTGVQRNAARAIGSRWWQIPQDQLSTYVQALKMNLRSKDEQLVNMTRRGIGLLTRTYDGDMFSRSPSGRWVIYERHGKPCVIDTQNHTEQLLGAGLEGTFFPSYNNDSLTRFCLWHPKEDMVALSILIWRAPSLVWVWRSEGGVRSLFSFPELKTVLKHANIEVSEQSAYYYEVEFKEWKGADLDFTVACSVGGTGEELRGLNALLRWESATDTVRFLADKPN